MPWPPRPLPTSPPARSRLLVVAVALTLLSGLVLKQLVILFVPLFIFHSLSPHLYPSLKHPHNVQLSRRSQGVSHTSCCCNLVFADAVSFSHATTTVLVINTRLPHLAMPTVILPRPRDALARSSPFYAAPLLIPPSIVSPTAPAPPLSPTLATSSPSPPTSPRMPPPTPRSCMCPERRSRVFVLLIADCSQPRCR
jgi:hypothetical protein